MSDYGVPTSNSRLVYNVVDDTVYSDDDRRSYRREIEKPVCTVFRRLKRIMSYTVISNLQVVGSMYNFEFNWALNLWKHVVDGTTVVVTGELVALMLEKSLVPSTVIAIDLENSYNRQHYVFYDHKYLT